MIFAKEIGVLINDVLDTELFRKEWNIIENNFNANIHPFVRDAFIAHKQIQNIIENKSTGITPEILAFGKIAFYINLLKRSSTKGIDKQLNLFLSSDYKTYLTARYALQIAGSLKNRSHQVAFIYHKESENSSIILISNGESKVEILCIHLDIEKAHSTLKCNTWESRKENVILSVYGKPIQTSNHDRKRQNNRTTL